MDKLRINAAMEGLINGVNVVSNAKVVIEYILSVPVKPPASFTGSITYTENKRGEKFRGNTDLGDVDYSSQEDRIEKKYSFGIDEPERIGHFKLLRLEQGLAVFYHYANSDELTQPIEEKRPPRYEIKFHPVTAELIHLAEVRTINRYLWRFWIITISIPARVCVYIYKRHFRSRPKRLPKNRIKGFLIRKSKR